MSISAWSKKAAAPQAETSRAICFATHVSRPLWLIKTSLFREAIWLLRQDASPLTLLPLFAVSRAAGRDDLLGLLERGLQAVAVAVLEFRERAGGDDRAPYHLERELDAFGHLRARRDLRQVNAELNHRLRDCRADAGEYAARAHQSGRRHGLDEVVGDERVHRAHARDVEDGDGRAGLDDLLQERLHHHLRAARIERADDGERQDFVPDLDDGRREFEHVRALLAYDLLARAYEVLDHDEAHLVQQAREVVHLAQERLGVALHLFRHERGDDVAQGKYVGRVLKRRVALDGALVRNLVEVGAQFVEGPVVKVLAARILYGLREHVEHLLRLLAQVFLGNQLVAELVGFEPLLDPEVEYLVAPVGEQRGDAPLVRVRGSFLIRHIRPRSVGAAAGTLAAAPGSQIYRTGRVRSNEI